MSRATVLSAPDAKGEVSVQAGAMKMKVKLADTRIAEPEAKSKAKPKKSSSFSPAAREVKTECDVRGMTKEEALSAVDLFIDAGILNKLKTLYIIHGKGTGVLRSGIQNYLKHHRMVAEFRLGHYGEGEDGVTVVTLK